MKRKLWILSLLIFCCCCCSWAGEAWTLRGSLDRKGLHLANGLETISLGSRVIAVDPAWKHRFFLQDSPVAVTTVENGMVITSAGPAGDAVLEEYSLQLNGSRALLTLRMSLPEAMPTTVEYTAMLPAPALLAGASYRAELWDGRQVSGAIPEKWTDRHNPETLLEDIRKVTFINRYGYARIVIEVLEGGALRLVDRRAIPFENQECFWLGGEMPLTTAGLASRIAVTYDRPEIVYAEPQPGGALPDALPGTAVKRVAGASMPPFPLLPQPKEIVPGTGELRLPEVISMSITGAAEADRGRLQRAAARLFGRETGATVTAAAAGEALLKITVADAPALPVSPDGYQLAIDSSGIAIDSRSARGAFYGLQTIRGLLRDGAIAVRTIRDYPDLEFRGIHLLVDDHSLAVQGELIEKVLAPLKINHLVLECEYAAWDATKELHRPQAISKADLRELIELAEENFIEVSPLLQTLGHCEWLFVDGKNLDMAEDVSFPYAYNVSNPEVYELMTAILDEIREMFPNARYLHIGHDEVNIFLNFPKRPENIVRGMAEIVYDDVMFYHRYATGHGWRLMMWHDMFATHQENPDIAGASNTPENLSALRDRLPKDIVFAVWRYEPETVYFADAAALLQEGFEVIGCPWNAYGNIENLARFCREHGALGLLQTSWTGYFGNQKLLDSEFPQVSAYVRAATRSWNGADAANGYDDNLVLGELLRRGEARPSGPGEWIDLGAVANLELTAEANPFLNHRLYGLEQLTPGPFNVGDGSFDLAGRDGKLMAVAVRSRLHPDFPAAVSLPLNRRGKALYFLQWSIACCQKTLTGVGRWLVRYRDGAEVEIPLLYGKTIYDPLAPFNYHFSGSNCRELGEGRLWFTRWANPYPEKEIASLTLQSGPAEYPVCLLALSLEQ